MRGRVRLAAIEMIFSPCISYWVLHNKHPSGLLASNIKHSWSLTVSVGQKSWSKFTGWLWLRSLMRLQSSSHLEARQRQKNPSPGALTSLLVASLNYWLEASVSCLMSFFVNCLRILATWQLDSWRSDARERKR